MVGTFAGMTRENFADHLFVSLYFPGLNVDVDGGALRTSPRLMNHDSRVRKGVSFPRGSRGQDRVGMGLSRGFQQAEIAVDFATAGTDGSVVFDLSGNKDAMAIPEDTILVVLRALLSDTTHPQARRQAPT